MRKIGIVFIVILFLSACKRDEKLNELKNYVNKTKQTAEQEEFKKTQVKFELPAPVTYEKTLPFAAQEANQPVDEKIAVANPLQAYSLQSYLFLGTLSMNGQILAYVLTPGNSIIELKKGDVISDQYGRIINIARDKIEILIETTNKGKQPSQRIVQMRLKE